MSECPRCTELEAELAQLRAKLTRRGKGGRKLTGEPKPSTLSSRASRARKAAGLPRLRAKKKMREGESL